ncbi:MAG: dihydrofolate reductase [Propionibacteriaceae bacterium]|jgi:dihydrofolate reductase|nr:dihydrofolate reductase [Propionibacteriaceae bacterium]
MTVAKGLKAWEDMTTFRLIGIAAVARNGVIGANGVMPWHIPEDLAHFKRVTMGGLLVMGRRTFESIGRPLEGRISVVVSSAPRPEQFPEGGTPKLIWEPNLPHVLATSLAIGKVLPAKVFVIGGGEMFRASWSMLTDLYITEVDATPAGDTFFPEIDPGHWIEVWREPHDGFAFVRYERIPTV